MPYGTRSTLLGLLHALNIFSLTFFKGFSPACILNDILLSRLSRGFVACSFYHILAYLLRVRVTPRYSGFQYREFQENGTCSYLCALGIDR